VTESQLTQPPVIPEKILILAGTNATWVKGALVQAAAFPTAEITLWFLSEADTALNLPLDELLINFKYQQYLQGAYAEKNWQAPPLEIRRLSLAQAVGVSAQFLDYRILLCPDYLTLKDGDLELTIAESQTSLIEHWQGLGKEPDEALLQALAQHKAPLWDSIEGWRARAETAAAQWLAMFPTLCEAAWNNTEGAFYRMLVDMRLWQHRSMFSYRDTINQAIRTLYKQPEHWGAHLALGLYKRRYRGLPSALPDWFETTWRELHRYLGRCLEIPDPVQNFQVTVALITYNRLDTLRRAVEGVISQTYSDWHLLVIDHGSNDGTAEYLKQIAAKYPNQTTLIRRPENGGVAALSELYQLLLQTTETELVILSSDDDWLLPTHLEKTVEMYKSHPWLGMAAGGYAAFTPDQVLDFQYGPHYEQSCIVETQRELQRALLSGVCPQACIYRKSLLTEFVAADVLLCKPEDRYALWDFMVTTKLLGHFEVGFVNEVLAGFTVSPASAFSGRDFTYELTVLMEEVLKDYNSLFGEASYPFEIVHNYVYNVLHPMVIKHFQHHLLNAESPEAFSAVIDQKNQGWLRFVAARTAIFDQVNRHIPSILRFNRPEAPTGN
jgi:glycosyltransferase involved in cell wall biosynthesis